ncbi:hypothetical protein EXS70_04265 [Candidatus Peribacteria bacterium]|nr:hypothetical protein [Candidatus Peribacteria bacterium]
MRDPNYDPQIEAAEDLLRGALQKKNPEDVGNDVCAIVDEILGPAAAEVEGGSRRTGLMNKEGAVDMLEQLRKILQNTVDEHGDELPPEGRKKFQERIALLSRRIQSAKSAQKNVEDMRTAIRKSAGGFKAYRE